MTKYLKHIINLFCLLVCGLIPQTHHAQTCCSGGVPVSGNLGLPASSEKTLQISLNYDLNELKTLREGSEKLDNLGSSRRTHAFILQTGFSFTERLSADAFLPYIRQERTSSDFEYSNGIGDLAVLFKYKILAKNDNQTVLTGALGIELPTGSDDMISNVPNRRFLLSADMQPGSGSLDWIGWAQFSQMLGFRKSMSFTAQGIYKFNGENEDFDEGARPYQFGPEFQISAGLSDRITFLNQIIDSSINFKFRKSFTDKSATFGEWIELPASGGNFLMLNPSLVWWINPSFSLNLSSELPIYTNVTLSQVTPTYRLNFGVYHRFEFEESDAKIIFE